MRPRTEPDAGVSCRVHADWLEADAVRLGSPLNRAFVSSSRKGRQRIEIGAQFGPSAYRLDATVRREEPREISVISRATGEVLWLDHHLRLFAKGDPERLPPKRTNSSMREVSAPAVASEEERRELLAESEHGSLDDPVVVRTTIRDARTHCDWEHYLVCDPARRVSPATLRTLLTVLLGDAELQAMAGFPWQAVHDLVSDAGLPVAGGMRLVGDTPARGSAFRIDGIELERLHDSSFAVPPDYRPALELREDEPRLPGGERPGGDATMRIDWRDPRDPPDGREIVPARPPTVPPPPAGEASVIGLWIPQSTLDAVRQTFNQLIRPLTGFRVFNGLVTFDWLAQLRSHWLEKRGAGGTLVYCALRDEPLPAMGDPTPARCSTFTGRGQLDHMAEEIAKTMVGAGTLPADVVSGLPAAVSADLTAAGTDWTALSSTSQARIACEVLWRRLGKLEFQLNDKAVNPADPLVIESPVATITIDQVAGNLLLPEVERSTTTPIIESRPVIKHLYCRNDAYIVAEVHLGTLYLNGRCAVTPTEEYWAGVAIAHLAAVFFPPLAALSTHAATVGLELLADGGNSVSLDLVDPKIFAYLTFRQNANGMFGPDLTFSISGALHVRFAPVSVTSLVGLFEILQEALRGWYTGLAFATLADQLTKEVYTALQGLFGAGFPSAVGRLGIPIVGGSKKGAANDHVYFEVELGTAPGSPPRRPIPVNPYQALRADVSAFRGSPPVGLHCLSLNLSENAVNEILAGRRRTGLNPPLVATMTSAQDLALLAGLAQPPADTSHFGFAWLGPVSTPTVRLVSAAGQYARVDVELEFTSLAADPISAGLIVPGVMWTFRLSAEAQIGIGSAQPPPGEAPTQILDFRRFPEHVCELLLDLDTSTITLLNLVVIPPTGSPQQVPVTPALAAQHQPLLRTVVQRACALHGFQREPRRDGIGAPPSSAGRTDGPLEQTYTIDGTDPDAAGGSPTVEFPVALGMSPGLLHMHGQLAGILSALLDGTRPLGAASSDCALGRQFLRP